MFDLPKPKLGDISAITITAPDLEKSLIFYQSLGFKELYRADMPFPWIQITDEALLIMLRKDDEPYIALTYYVKDIDKLVGELEAEGITFATRPKANHMIKRCLMKSPDGMNVSLVNFVEGFMQPTGKTMLTMAPQDFANPDKYANNVCGLFGEFAHPVADIDKAMLFWEKLGFKILSRMTMPYEWAIISDGLSIVGLHQTTNFSSPTITFFAADMKEKIDKIKSQGLTEFIDKGSANITITTPEKQKINLFKLGM
ncbi:MAG: VOC family protein [Ginsengibacter sp.]